MFETQVLLLIVKTIKDINGLINHSVYSFSFKHLMNSSTCPIMQSDNMQSLVYYVCYEYIVYTFLLCMLNCFKCLRDSREIQRSITIIRFAPRALWNWEHIVQSSCMLHWTKLLYSHKACQALHEKGGKKSHHLSCDANVQLL